LPILIASINAEVEYQNLPRPPPQQNCQLTSACHKLAEEKGPNLFISRKIFAFKPQTSLSQSQLGLIKICSFGEERGED